MIPTTFISSIILGKIAGVLSFCAYISYIRSTLRGETKPSRSTWWILTLVGAMILITYYAEGARSTIWVPVAYVIGPFIIALLSLKYGEGSKWEPLDKICFSLAVISIAIWYATSSAFIALILNIGIDFLGLIPTIKKAYLRPESEDRTAWTLESFAGVINIIALDSSKFSIIIYPIYLLTLNSAVAMLLYRRKK